MTVITRAIRVLAILYLLLALACSAAVLTGKPYGSPAYTANAGYVWDNLGGIETYGDPGLFLCPATISPLPLLPMLMPDQVVDC